MLMGGGAGCQGIRLAGSTAVVKGCIVGQACEFHVLDRISIIVQTSNYTMSVPF